MSKMYTYEYFKKELEVPEDIIQLALKIPKLLPGETDDDFLHLFAMMVAEVLPDADAEWLWTIDISWLWFDIQRYRRWKNAILLASRGSALEAILAKTHPATKDVGVTPMISALARQEARAMQTDPDNKVLNARLEDGGYDSDAINAAAFMHGIVSLSVVERLLTSARQQVMAILREVQQRQAFAKRANAAVAVLLEKKNAAKVSQNSPPKQTDGDEKAA